MSGEPVLAGRVVVVTGAGRGIGREHALFLAAQGAAVVVNDARDPADVVAEVVAAGGRAVAHVGDVADWGQAHGLVAAAVESFGRLDALVNNAGGGGAVPLAELTEQEWDDVVRLNLKGTFCPTRAAVAHWLAERAAGREVRAAVVNTTSGAGLLGNPGQSHYGAAKAGVAAFTAIVAQEVAGTGIRLNAIAPAARTPAVLGGGYDEVARLMRPPDDPDDFDAFHPANVSPLVAYLVSEACAVSGEVFHVRGDVVGHFQGWTIPEMEQLGRRWTVAELAERVPAMLAVAPDRSAAGGAAYQALRAAMRPPA